MIEEDYFHAAALQLIQQQYLIGVLPRESVGAMNVEAINRARGCYITQSFQGWSNQRCSAIPFIEKPPFAFQR